MKRIFAIDPGTITGVARNYLQPGDPKEAKGSEWMCGVWVNKTKAKTKKHPAEPKHMRLVMLWQYLEQELFGFGFGETPDLIVMEDAAGFMRGKAAVAASHQFRGVVLLWCGLKDIPVHLIQPADVKRYALDKGTATKEEMIAAARRKYGYVGDDDNEADALHILHWAMENLG